MVSGIPVLKQSRLVVVELGETGTDIDIDLVKAGAADFFIQKKICSTYGPLHAPE